MAVEREEIRAALEFQGRPRNAENDLGIFVVVGSVVNTTHGQYVVAWFDVGGGPLIVDWKPI